MLISVFALLIVFNVSFFFSEGFFSSGLVSWRWFIIFGKVIQHSWTESYITHDFPEEFYLLLMWLPSVWWKLAILEDNLRNRGDPNIEDKLKEDYNLNNESYHKNERNSKNEDNLEDDNAFKN